MILLLCTLFPLSFWFFGSCRQNTLKRVLLPKEWKKAGHYSARCVGQAHVAMKTNCQSSWAEMLVSVSNMQAQGKAAK